MSRLKLALWPVFSSPTFLKPPRSSTSTRQMVTDTPQPKALLAQSRSSLKLPGLSTLEQGNFSIPLLSFSSLTICIPGLVEMSSPTTLGTRLGRWLSGPVAMLKAPFLTLMSIILTPMYTQLSATLRNRLGMGIFPISLILWMTIPPFATSAPWPRIPMMQTWRSASRTSRETRVSTLSRCTVEANLTELLNGKRSCYNDVNVKLTNFLCSGLHVAILSCQSRCCCTSRNFTPMMSKRSSSCWIIRCRHVSKIF